MQQRLLVPGLLALACATAVASRAAAAPVINGPADVSIEAAGPVTSVRLGEISGDFPVGRTVVQWTATDEQGRATSGSQIVIVTDTTPPRLAAPADIAVEASGALTAVEFQVPVADDVVDGALTPAPDQSGPFAPGVYTILWTARDRAGNSTTATQTIRITDSVAPTLTVPADVAIEATGALTRVAPGEATASDTVDAAVQVTHDAPAEFPVGVTKVVWTATDTSGNISRATQLVTVTDTTEPVITVPADIHVEAAGAKTPVELGVATAVDVVDGALNAKPDQVGPFTVGNHSVTWAVKDKAGNSAAATQIVTVTDTTAPAITPPADVAVEATAFETPIKIGAATAVDLVDGKLMPVADAAGPFGVGEHVVTWRATDIAGNTGTATQRIVVTDTSPPKVAAPAAIAIEAIGKETPVELGTAVARDIVDGELAATPDITGPFMLGTHVVTWTATDRAGNSGRGTQTVVVTDRTAPAITPPADISVEASGPMTPLELGVASANDVVDGALAPLADNLGPFAVGRHTIIWTATDGAGNAGKASQTVTVTDTTVPDVAAPAAISVEATGAKTPVDLGVATAVDLVDGTMNATPDQTGPFTVGSRAITWSATDKAGNTGTATQTVAITDTTAPALTPPADLAVEATAFATPVKLGSASASDIVDGALTAVADNTGPFTVGDHTVAWRVTDAAGNTATATQKVAISDTTPPQVTPPSAVTVEATGMQTPVDAGQATAVDLVDGAVAAAPDRTGPYQVGDHTITWSATDSAGNTASATQSIKVTDTTRPALDVPADITAEATHIKSQVTLGTAKASDSVDAKPVIRNDAPGGFGVGTTVVTWYATDFAGNVASGTQRVTITDTTAPSIKPPRDVIVEATGAVTAVDLGEAVASDVVDGDLKPAPDQRGPFAPGVYTITWHATDKAGNTGVATQPVTVTDKTPPRLVAEADVTVEAVGPATPVALTVTADDLVDGSLQPSSDAPQAFPVGVTMVTWTAMDRAGNSSSLSRTVTVVDTTPPVVTAPVDVHIEATGAQTAVALGDASAVDKVDGELAPTPDQTGPFAPGVYTITWSVTDHAGNLNTATQRVFVTDRTPPQVTPPPDQTAEATGPTTALEPGVATAADLVDGAVTVKADRTGPFKVGAHKITWSATDAANNTGSATQTITISDSTPPVVTPPPDITTEATSAATALILGDASAIDLVDGPVIARPDVTGPFPPGTHVVTWHAQDAAGNTATATQTVTITDTTPPSITAPADLNIEADAPLTTVNLGAAAATDNIDVKLVPMPDQAGPFAPGGYTITWSVTDGAGNPATATQQLVVSDTRPPDIQVPDDIAVEATGPETAVDPGVATAIDRVDGNVTVVSDAPALFPIDTTVITWRAKDRAGNESSATQFVTIEDKGAPVVTPPPDVTITATGDETAVDLGTATAADVVDGELSAEPDMAGPFAVGIHKVTWTATDSAGKKGTATQTVTVVAPAAPDIPDTTGDGASTDAGTLEPAQ